MCFSRLICFLVSPVSDFVVTDLVDGNFITDVIVTDFHLIAAFSWLSKGMRVCV